MEQFISGTLKNHGTYSTFSPSLINRNFDCKDQELDLLYGDAMQHLGALDAYSTLVPDITFFLTMNGITESTKSNKIEGTKTEIEEAVLPEMEIEDEKREDWKEVRNYIKAMNFAIKKLTELPISVRLIREAHKHILQGVRGEHKRPRELRQSQNWIGGATIEEATFVPPQHTEVPDLLTDLEQFWHNTNILVPPLIRIAIIHYQLETIHPFLDGNGRVGRVLIVLQLIEAGILQHPAIAISDFFEKHRVEYYHRFTCTRTDNDLKGWVRFFLQAVVESAKKNIRIFNHAIQLREKYHQQIQHLGRRATNAYVLLPHLFSTPVMSVKTAQKVLNTNYVTANALLLTLVEVGILREKTGYARNRFFVLEEYLKLYQD